MVTGDGDGDCDGWWRRGVVVVVVVVLVVREWRRCMEGEGPLRKEMRVGKLDKAINS